MQTNVKTSSNRDNVIEDLRLPPPLPRTPKTKPIRSATPKHTAAVSGTTMNDQNDLYEELDLSALGAVGGEPVANRRVKDLIALGQSNGDLDKGNQRRSPRQARVSQKPTPMHSTPIDGSKKHRAKGSNKTK